MDKALLMDEKTKAQMIDSARAALRRNDLNKWVSDQLKDIEVVMYERQELKSSENPEEARLMN
jgi:trehalose-6-phosphate synthase